MNATATQIEDQAQAWINATFNDPHGKSYWQNRFTAENMEDAFAAGFAAARGAAISWEFQAADGSWKPCRNERDAAMWEEDGRKIRPSKAA